MNAGLVARWRQRILVFGLGAVPAAVVVGALAGVTPLVRAPVLVAAWLALGLVADVGWSAIQRRRADGDWPPLFGLLGLVTECALLTLLVARGLVPSLPACAEFEMDAAARLMTCIAPTFSARQVLMLFASTVAISLLGRAVLAILFPRWRYPVLVPTGLEAVGRRPADASAAMPRRAPPVVLAAAALAVAIVAVIWLWWHGAAAVPSAGMAVAAGLAGLVAALAGLSAGVLLLPAAILARDSGAIGASFAGVADALALVSLAGLAAGLLAQYRPVGRRNAPRPGSVAFAVCAGAVPTTLLARAGAAPIDRLATAFDLITALILGGVLVVAAFSSTADPLAAETDEPPRLRRRDWWALGAIGALGGYLGRVVPFGTAELVMIYLVLRQFRAVDVAPAALAVALPPAGLAAAFALVDGQPDPALAFAMVPAVFLGSLAARAASDRIGAQVPFAAASVWVVASSIAAILRILV